MLLLLLLLLLLLPCSQVEISKGYGVAEWREDIRNCLLQAGLKDKPIVFLFNDVQVRRPPASASAAAAAAAATNTHIYIYTFSYIHMRIHV